MFAYTDPAIHVGFMPTHFYEPYQFYGDIRLNENITQDLPPK